MWEPPFGEVEPPPGEDPLVVVAPSTSQDRDQRLLSAALNGLADLPVRVLATFNRRPPPKPVRVPANARLVEWMSYSRTMRDARVVVCHAGHGTLARALAGGATVVAVPAAGDMAENGARLQWSGAGVSLPNRLLTPRTVRWAVQRVLERPGFRSRAQAIARWSAENDGPAAAAAFVEGFADRMRTGPQNAATIAFPEGQGAKTK
jgi:UDP:flavonoid glycosyltransferase YjiC (YdhE family)